ncbi:MAG: hypothetical protein K0R27_1460 [Xanthobacteraceae bacterium]|nr:hypothetical protein [Xanthobacteraceae bacterium]
MLEMKIDSDLVFITEAAVMLRTQNAGIRVSKAMVRRWRRTGALAAAEKDGRPAVTRSSVRALSVELRANPELAKQRRARHGTKRPHLRLVVDNT